MPGELLVLAEEAISTATKTQPPPQEDQDQQSMAEQMGANLAALRNKVSSSSPDPTSQSSAGLTIPSKGDQLLRNLLRMTTPMVNRPDPLPITGLQRKRQALESNRESLKLLDEIMRRQEQKNPELAAKQAKLLQILATPDRGCRAPS